MSVARRRKSATAHVRLANVALLAIGVLTVLSAVIGKVLGAALDLNIALIVAGLAACASAASLISREDEHVETTNFNSESLGPIPNADRTTSNSIAEDIRAAKLQAIGALAAGLAHELRNPLVAVQTLVEGLQRHEALSERGLEMAGVTLREVARIKGILDRLLDFARGGREVSAQAVDVNEVIRASLEVCGVTLGTDQVKRRGLRVDLRLRSSARVFGVPDQLQAVFTNLIANALDAMPKGGTLTISTEGDGPVIRIRVQDTGSGVPAEIAPRIFDPFFTTKEAGTGLGLAVAYSIVHGHRGSIRLLESRKNQGSTFEVELPTSTNEPLERSSVASAPSLHAPSIGGVRGKRVLVVDDERGVLDSIRLATSESGVELELCDSGQEALEKVRSREFDIVLIDYKMPGSSGDVIAREIKRLRPEARVVFITAWAEELKRPLRDYGVDDLVAKPFGLDELQRVFSEASRN